MDLIQYFEPFSQDKYVAEPYIQSTRFLLQLMYFTSCKKQKNFDYRSQPEKSLNA